MLRQAGKFTAISYALAMALMAVVRADSPDEAGRGVARISVINGDVSVQRGDSGDWVAAALNAPLVVQDRVLTGPGSRAEVQFDYSNMVRLAANSEVRLAELDNGRYLIQLGRGTIIFRVLRDQPKADTEISTPSVSVRPVRRGVYRITVQPDGASEISVRSGEADIYTPKGSERIHSGQTMYARGNPQDPEFQVGGAVPRDEFEAWNEGRDRELESSRSYQYVSSDVYGAEELDAHGRWENTPEYGYVWVPTTSAGWAPYRYGRWSWVDYYGWSWVSYDPWGWAPYHYGRWFYRPAAGWCWWPGGLRTRHYWSPALVAFFGFGNVHVGVGFGNVGWVPLAPYEPLHRWWGRGYYGGYRNTTYIDNSVYIVNNVNIVNTYRNAGVVNGVTGVSRGAFGRERITNTNLVAVRHEDMRGAALVRGQVPFAPTRESLRMADRDVRTEQVRGASDSTRFFSHRQPTAVDRVPFEQQRQGVEQIARRTFGETGRGGTSDGVVTRGGAAASPNVRGAEIQRAQTGESTPAAAGRGDSGWRRMGERTTAGEGRAAEQTLTPRAAEQAPVARTGEGGAPTRGQDGGWRRFGDPGPAARTSDTPRAAPERTVESQPARSESRGGDNQWRRFGDPGPARESTPAVEHSSGRGSSGERAAPERSSTPERSSGAERNSTSERSAPADRGGRWQRFTDSGSQGFSQPSVTQSAPPPAPTPRYEAPQRTYQAPPAPRYEAPRRTESSGFGRSEAIRSAPPVVRERPAEHSSGGGSARSGGSASHSDGGNRGGGSRSGGESRSNGGRGR
jgi:hypothetical protein